MITKLKLMALPRPDSHRIMAGKANPKRHTHSFSDFLCQNTRSEISLLQMSRFSDQLREIKVSIYSKSSKPSAYSSLLHLLESSSDDPLSIQTLARDSHSLVALLVTDISDDQEEIAVQALKCLGFMIYHPSPASAISEHTANLVLESLAELIVKTKIKYVCNLAVWCLSIQQLDASYIAAHFQLLLRAVLHAIDNPFGSLSTTYEAMQGLMKFGTQLRGKMKEFSYVWIPSICRRLVSSDKRERDTSERCLLQVKSVILPPSVALSKVLADDMKKHLLHEMNNMLYQGMKLQAIKAWGWFIRLLGYHSLKQRRLLNDMLKIPEQTFSDHNVQVQIASLVSWEGLIDVLIQSPVLDDETKIALRQQGLAPRGKGAELQTGRFLRILNLTMEPLKGIVLSKCDASVHQSFFNTWCFLLHKLSTSISCLSVRTLVLDPIFEAVFKMEPDNRNMWLWNQCLKLLHEFILTKPRLEAHDTNSRTNGHVLAAISVLQTSASETSLQLLDDFKSFSWDLSHLDFLLKMVDIIFSPSNKSNTETRSMVFNAALMIFRSVLRGVQVELKKLSKKYEIVMFCLDKILKFVNKISDQMLPEGSGCNEISESSLVFLESVVEELEPTILGCPRYKVALDLKYIEKLQSVNGVKLRFLHGISINYMDMVSPIIYLLVLYLCVVLQEDMSVSRMSLDHEISRFFKIVLSLYDASEALRVSSFLLYKHIECHAQEIWIRIAEGMRECITDVKVLSLRGKEGDWCDYSVLCCFLAYPCIIFSCPQNMSQMETCDSLEQSLAPPKKLLYRQTVERWKSLYCYIRGSISDESSAIRFSVSLSVVLSGCLDENAGPQESAAGNDTCPMAVNYDGLSLFGEFLICIIERILSSEVSTKQNKSSHQSFQRESSKISSIVEFASKFLKLSLLKIQKVPAINSGIDVRAISAMVCFISSLKWKQDILTVIEIMKNPLFQWLSRTGVLGNGIDGPLQNLWAETLNSLQRSQPPIASDSSCLELLANLLQKALDHPNPLILEPTIKFWNSTYGEQNYLVYPQNLCSVLEKLSMQGRINRCTRYVVTSTSNTKLKRVEIGEDALSESSVRRKRLDLTEHQKEVR